MSTVVAFPVERCSRPGKAPVGGACARIYILPVVRIERHEDRATDALPPLSPAPVKPRRLLS